MTRRLQSGRTEHSDNVGKMFDNQTVLLTHMLNGCGQQDTNGTLCFAASLADD